jgi:PKD repeat protein
MKLLLPLTCGALAILARPASAQLHPEGSLERGGAIIQGCDPSLQVDILPVLTGPYTYAFYSAVEPGNNSVLDLVWQCYNGSFYEQTGAYCDVVFPGQAEYPVCLTVNAFDLTASIPCSTSVCRLIEALPDVSCESLDADFTIAAINGQTITFTSTSEFSDPLQTFWSYGEEAMNGEPEGTHTYSGPGPHKVCMTVVGPPPVYCNATVCKWLYLGPGDLPCEVVVDQGFVLYQENDLIGVLDTSMTSGMESDVLWDFGDGSSSTGRLAVHRYTMPGTYTLCSTVDVWGPLLSDTCSNMACVPVETMTMVTVPEHPDQELLRAWPVPLTDRMHVIAPWPDASLVLMDTQGRQVAHWMLAGQGEQAIDLNNVQPGAYVLECWSQGRYLRRAVIKP